MKNLSSHIRFSLRLLTSAFLITLAGLSIFAAPGDLDISFRPAIGSIGSNSDDITHAVQPDGKIIVGGGFVIVGGEIKSNLARLNADGTLDTSFHAELDGTVRKIFLQSDGKILISGFFSEPNGFNFARLNSDGSRDATFNSVQIVGIVNSVAFQPDGKIIIGGNFSLSSTLRRSLLRLNNDGTLDGTFNTNIAWTTFRTSNVRDVLLLPDGKILVGGMFYRVNDIDRFGLVRLNSDGSLDTTFPNQLSVDKIVFKLARQPDGKILVAGDFDMIQGIERRKIARLNADGTVDASFIPASLNFISSFFLQADGKILVNWFSNNPILPYLARLNADGSLDSTFNQNQSFGQAVVLLPDGKILTVPSTTINNNLNFIKIHRLNQDGSLDNTIETFQAKAGIVRAILKQPDGKTLIGGGINSVGTRYVQNIARLNQDGSIDNSFNGVIGTNLSVSVNTLALQPDGKILVGLGFFPEGKGVVRLNSDGSPDSSFNSGTIIASSFASVNSIALQSDGKIYIGGDFFYLHNGVQLASFVRLNSDGSLDTSFTLKPGNGSSVNKIIVQPDGKILVAGSIRPGGNFRYAIERLNPNNTIDATFNNTLIISDTVDSPKVSSLALLPNGKILYGNSQIRRLNPNGSEDDTFSVLTAVFPNFTPKEISALTVQPNGKILIGGSFISIANGSNSVNQRYAARLNPDGAIDLSFAPLLEGKAPGAGDSAALAFAIEPNGKILIGGSFTRINKITRPALARLMGDSVRPSFDFDGDGKSDISVFRNGVWHLQRSQLGFAALNWGVASDVIAPADFDGDGKTDLTVYRPSNGEWSVFRSLDHTIFIVRFGAPEDFPRPADYDGDGKADICVFRPSNGTWYRLNSSNGQFVATAFGQAGDAPLIADFDGDGKSDIAVFRPSNGTWYRLNSQSGSFFAVAFGQAGDTPTLGDYDGDGRSEIAVFRPSGGVWYRLNSGDGNFYFEYFGTSGDRPIPSAFVQ